MPINSQDIVRMGFNHAQYLQGWYGKQREATIIFCAAGLLWRVARGFVKIDSTLERDLGAAATQEADPEGLLPDDWHVHRALVCGAWQPIL